MPFACAGFMGEVVIAGGIEGYASSGGIGGDLSRSQKVMEGRSCGLGRTRGRVEGRRGGRYMDRSSRLRTRSTGDDPPDGDRTERVGMRAGQAQGMTETWPVLYL